MKFLAALLLSGFLSGCLFTSQTSTPLAYCRLSFFMTPNVASISWLPRNDPALSAAVLLHNRTWLDNCKDAPGGAGPPVLQGKDASK